MLFRSDDDGNQTLIKTSTGIWQVQYNGENRPILWECITPDSSTPNSSTPPLISMSYDRMGRRVTKNNQRFVYDGYLQIANFELQTSNIKLQTFIWDPTETVATRPLVWFGDAFVVYYTHDGNKNVSEILDDVSGVCEHSEYAPFGALHAHYKTFTTVNPWRFSSEYAETDTATVYYNYRHFVPEGGRWVSRDQASDEFQTKAYLYLNNNVGVQFDLLGLFSAVEARSECQDVINRKRGRAGWITHTGQGEVVGYRECYKKIVDAIGYEPLSTVLRQFGDECPLPKIQCDCCSWSEKKGEGYSFILGKYVHENRTVTICWNNLKRFRRGNENEMNKLLTHELTHALQSCKGMPGGCGGSLKKEIEARICSGECSDFDGCFKASIKSSCGYHCTESRQITDALYNDVKRWYDLKMSKPGEKGDFCKFYP